MDQLVLSKIAKDLNIDTPLVTHGTEALHLVAGAQSRDTNSKCAPIFGLTTAVATGVDSGNLTRKGDSGGLGAKLGHLEEEEG